MRWFRFAVLLCLATVLQAGFLANLSIKPDLLLIVLVFFAVYSNTADAIITSFTIGFAADLIGRTMGPQMISFGLFGTLLAYLRRVIAIRKMPYQGLAIFVTALLAGALAYLLDLLTGPAGRASREELLHKLLDMMACKAAVKAGDELGEEEVRTLLAQRERVERSSNCPHGRPTTIRMSWAQMERQFKRT